MKSLVILIFFVAMHVACLFAGMPEVEALCVPGDINELDRYVMKEKLCQHWHAPDDLLRPCTIEYLPLDILVNRIREATKQLKKTINGTRSGLALDEHLRREVWNLSESIDVLDGMIGDSIDPALHFVRPLKKDAAETVKLGYQTYQVVMENIQQMLAQENLSQEAGDFIQFATEGRISEYAERFEQEYGLTEWNKYHEACGSTARAIFYYFQHKYRNERPADTIRNPILGFDNLVSQLQQNHLNGNAYFYLVESNKLDHVFVIYQSADGYYRIFQSYVGEYSLQASLAEQYLQSGGWPYLNDEQFQDYLTDLHVLLHAEAVDHEIEELHKKMFHIPFPKLVRDNFSQIGPHLHFSVMVVVP